MVLILYLIWNWSKDSHVRLSSKRSCIYTTPFPNQSFKKILLLPILIKLLFHKMHLHFETENISLGYLTVFIQNVGIFGKYCVSWKHLNIKNASNIVKIYLRYNTQSCISRYAINPWHPKSFSLRFNIGYFKAKLFWDHS